MEYYAHTRDDGQKQTVRQHLEGVEKLAVSYSPDYLRPIVAKAALYHDIGKYAVNFQRRLEGSSLKFSHAVCGAIEYKNVSAKNDVYAPLIEFCIAGHHTGLMDGGFDNDIKGEITLCGNLKREEDYTGDNDYSAYRSEICVTPLADNETAAFKQRLIAHDKAELIERYAFFTKLAFSCLTDADFLDTEGFCSQNVRRDISGDLEKALHILDSGLNDKAQKAETPLQKARSRLQQQAFENAQHSSNISILDMPTGSGKTLCSLKIALEKARKGGKRIIYVIPYTSIIEQTAFEFEEMFHDVLPVLQHHSNYSFEDKSNDSSEDLTSEKLKKACENWDAPLIVTTSVQFFQSFYHYKGSALRKLHNLRDSVVVFDEIHLIPVDILRPCLKAVGYMTEYLNSQAIFLSATMPDYSKLFDRFLPDVRYTELVTDKKDTGLFKKCRYTDLGERSLEEIAHKAAGCGSCLIVVNTKKTALELYELVQGRKYHLSANMTPAHRSRVINEIKHKLREGSEPVTVVSTSLIEAGVDLDFPVVFRQLAGLDSILQAGGRCNRNGKLAVGEVFIFEYPEDKPGGCDLAYRINKTKGLLSQFADISSPECIKAYFNGIFDFNDDKIAINSIANFNAAHSPFDPKSKLFKVGSVSHFRSIPFRSYAMNFQYIKDDTTSIVIDDKCDSECHQLVERLRAGDTSVRRSLQKYSVSVYRYTLEDLIKQGAVSDHGTGIMILENDSYYNNETGLSTNASVLDYFV